MENGSPPGRRDQSPLSEAELLVELLLKLEIQALKPLRL